MPAPRRHTLLCTVGTSLQGNLHRLGARAERTPAQESLHRAYADGAWDSVPALLARLDPTARLCGAEINTIEHLRRRKEIKLERVVFLVSDTPMGHTLGEVLATYLAARDDMEVRDARVQAVAGLRDDDPWTFKKEGLRNLVRHIAHAAREWGRDHVAIDATGGYKAQIALAVLTGQALDVPVYYKHERFDHLIDFPPLPVTFDYDLLGQHAGLLAILEQGETLTEEDVDAVPGKLRVLLEEATVDGTRAYALGPLGQVFLEGFRARVPPTVALEEAPEADRMPPRFPDDHDRPKGFEAFVRKVFRETPWITRITAIQYGGQRALRGITFDAREVGEGAVHLQGTYQDRDHFGGRFRIFTTDDAPRALAWAADQLNQRYRTTLR